MSRHIMKERGAVDPRLTPEALLESVARFEAAFDRLPETDQILTRHAQRLHLSYGVYDPTGVPRIDTARKYLTREFGPKFAERVLEYLAYRKLLGIDDPPIKPSENKTVVVTD